MISIATLKRIRGITDYQAHAIRMIMDPRDTLRSKRFRMDLIDAVLHTSGVETIPRGRNSRSPEIIYCNMGDTYDTTILLVRGRFRVGSWGDIVERGDYA